MTIRLLAPGDEALLRRAAPLADHAPDLARCRALLAEPTFVAVVALAEDGAPVGFAYGHVLHRPDADSLLLYSIDTDEAHRRHGAARGMIEALKALCVARGYDEMWVLTDAANAPAMALYPALGGVREAGDIEVMWVFPTPA